MSSKKSFSKRFLRNTSLTNKVLSLSISLFVITVLILSGPAQAITLGITDAPSQEYENTDITFKAKIDLHTNDVVPLQDVTAVIKDASSTTYTCTFDLDGNKISCDARFKTVSCVRDMSYSPSYGYGYGWNGSETSSTYFTNGYGYQAGKGNDAFNENVGTTAELVCTIVFTTPEVNADRYHYLDLSARADDGNNQVIYKTKTTTSLLVKDIPTCSDGIQNQNEAGPDCGGVCGGYWYDGVCNADPEPSGGSGGCFTYWACSAWSSCIDGTQTRTCDKAEASCYVRDSKPSEYRDCTVSPPSSETPGVYACGDGVCNAALNENAENCPADCASSVTETAPEEEGTLSPDESLTGPTGLAFLNIPGFGKISVPWFIVMLIILLALLGLGGYYTWRWYNK